MVAIHAHRLYMVRSRLYMVQGRVPSPTLSPTDPVPRGQLWPTGPIYSLYAASVGENVAEGASATEAQDAKTLCDMRRHSATCEDTPRLSHPVKTLSD